MEHSSFDPGKEELVVHVFPAGARLAGSAISNTFTGLPGRKWQTPSLPRPGPQGSWLRYDAAPDKNIRLGRMGADLMKTPPVTASAKYATLCGSIQENAKWQKSHFESGAFNRALPPLRDCGGTGFPDIIATCRRASRAWCGPQNECASIRRGAPERLASSRSGFHLQLRPQSGSSLVRGMAGGAVAARLCIEHVQTDRADGAQPLAGFALGMKVVEPDPGPEKSESQGQLRAGVAGFDTQHLAIDFVLESLGGSRGNWFCRHHCSSALATNAGSRWAAPSI